MQACHFSTGGGGERGSATFVWQERAHTGATQMTHLRPQASFDVLKSKLITSPMRHLLVTEKQRTTHLGTPPPPAFKKVSESVLAERRTYPKHIMLGDSAVLTLDSLQIKVCFLL